MQQRSLLAILVRGYLTKKRESGLRLRRTVLERRLDDSMISRASFFVVVIVQVVVEDLRTFERPNSLL